MYEAGGMAIGVVMDDSTSREGLLHEIIYDLHSKILYGTIR